MNNGDVTIKTDIDNTDFEKGMDEVVDTAEEKGEEAGRKFKEGFEDKSSETEPDVDLEDTEEKVNGMGSALQSVFSSLIGKMTGLGRGVGSILTTIGKTILGAGIGLGKMLGIVGLIVIAVMILAKAFMKVFEENDSIIADIKYLVWVINQALAPAVDFVAKIFAGILKVIIHIIGYTIALLNLLTGGKLFGDIGADKYAESMKSAEDSTGGMAKNLKDAKKQLAGFDEMNVLSDNQGGGSGIGGAVETPEFQMPDIQISDFEAKIQEMIDKWYEFGAGIRTFFEETNFQEEFGNWGLAVEGVTEIILGLWEIITGFGEIAVGIIKMITGLITGDMEQVKEGFDLFIQGIVHLIDGVYKFMEGIVKAIVGIIWGVITTIHDWFSAVVTWILNNVIKPIADFFVGLWDGVVKGVVTAWENIKKWFNEGVKFIKKLIGQIWDKMIEFGSNVADGVAGAFKGIINSVLGWVEKTINKFLRAINSAIDFINAIPGVNIGHLREVSFPRLAQGGIVNNPGPGVMMGSYIAGEKGPEAVIPLDDETLDRLGEAFARHTVINASIINSMNGKVISRELQRIQNEIDFAFNR